MTDKECNVVGWFSFLCGLATGIVIVAWFMSFRFEAEAIRHSAAYYDPITAKFTWKSPESKEPEIAPKTQ